MEKSNVKPAEGKLGILCVGLGAVSSTFINGTLMIRKGLGVPVGSITQLAKIRVGKGADAQYKHVSEIVSMPTLDDIVFGAWDILPDNAFESSMHAEVLRDRDIYPVKDELEKIVPMKGVYDPNYVKALEGTWVKDPKATRWELMEQVREDIRNFKEKNGCSRIVVIWAASTEIYVPRFAAVHDDLDAFEAAMKADDREHISPSMCYAYAALAEGAPFIMGAPNTCLDFPAMWQFAEKTQMPIAGKDFKTGQTMMKTVLSAAFRTRMLGVSGWFSTNILGNRDGLVLDVPENFKTKEVSKLGVIDTILKGDEYPELYSDIFHKVRINYYPPRNDDKEGWDNIDIFGWMGYPMQIKVDFLCKDSILAAPLLLDLALLSDLGARAGKCGIQTWLSFYLKSPMHDDEHLPVHDLFQQYTMLKNAIREMGGYEADEAID
ncbi:MAG: inositol-3-phosphate synthase [Prevotella sp.]|nr:inositol-3-phosphate synthase [Bacteroidales bacterium]MDY4732505.1 inositol-3-phosphate synthase [Prevotella sp.]MDY6027240.1 inositol-3-phosphate synthase [Prevotella sp.]